MISENSTFHTAIFDALCACLGLSAEEGIQLIHEAYAEPENVPRPGRNQNVIYWSVLQEPGLAVPAAWTGESGTAGHHVPAALGVLQYQLVVVCYGPACEAYASRICSMLFLDGAGFPRRILRDAGIYPVPDPPQPSLLYEEEGSLWRKRADLTVSLRVRDEQRGPERGSVLVAPTIVIRRSV